LPTFLNKRRPVLRSELYSVELALNEVRSLVLVRNVQFTGIDSVTVRMAVKWLYLAMHFEMMDLIPSS
jgi:hypothetical protein